MEMIFLFMTSGQILSDGQLIFCEQKEDTLKNRSILCMVPGRYWKNQGEPFVKYMIIKSNLYAVYPKPI